MANAIPVILNQVSDTEVPGLPNPKKCDLQSINPWRLRFSSKLFRLLQRFSATRLSFPRLKAHYPNYARARKRFPQDPCSVGFTPSPALVNAYQAFTPLPTGEGGNQKGILSPRHIGGEGTGVRGIVSLVHNLGTSLCLGAFVVRNPG